VRSLNLYIIIASRLPAAATQDVYGRNHVVDVVCLGRLWSLDWSSRRTAPGVAFISKLILGKIVICPAFFDIEAIVHKA
jgi:hypothetical protein